MAATAATAATVATAAVTIASFSTAPVHALPIPLDPSDPTVSELWVNPSARADDEISDVDLEISSFTMPNNGLAARVGESVKAQVKVTNRTSQTLSNITLQARRQEASFDVASARVAATSNAYGYFGAASTLDSELEPGESVEVDLEIPLDSLLISQAGSFPTMLELSGQLDGVASHLDSQRFLLPVVDDAQELDAPTPTTMIYPISAQTNVLGGETGEAPEDPPLLVSSDALAGELEASGRLQKLIDAYLHSSPAVQQATCLAIDPQLLDVVDRMTGGYTVTDTRPSTVRQNQRLRELWTADNQPNPGTPGTGAEDAAVFLEKLRQAAASSCTVALPWANTDLNAVSETGNQWLMREALQRGVSTFEEVLGVVPESNVVIPGNGYVDPSTAGDLGWADNALAPDQAWEVQSQDLVASADASEQSALDNPKPTPGNVEAPTPTTPVSVLVSDNTVWRTTSADRFHSLAPGVTAVSYQGSLSATLATLGENPETVGYSNPDSRYDYAMDSESARNLTGQAALRLTVDNGDEDSPVLVMPSAVLGADDGEMLLRTTEELLLDGSARPFSLKDYLTTNAEQQSILNAATTPPDDTAFGAPYDDPATLTETEILRTTQQAEYIDDLTGIMFNDPSIALTRYGFTAPLRHDLLRALSINERRSVARHSEAASRADRLLNGNRDTLQKLRSSVALLPPGNVYTRTSDSSPLLIVAQNGLPLPAETQILYSGNQQAHINTPGVVRIPAQGSITLQMTADLPDESARTDLTLWLASPDGATISEPVEITVQPRPNLSITLFFVAAGILAVGGLLFMKKKRNVEKRLPGTGSPKPPPTH
ncbi:hypothetical protein [Corynebacterium suranareeae]|uniref:hypothetical protein n=1 Tax=Corynebacterium suranareeae TaxID=2506452 RepID=UPI0038B81A1F